MKKISLAALLLLTACVGGTKPVDGKSYLNSLEGPNVPTMQDSLSVSAKAAEKQGDFKQAAILYQQILEKHPEDTSVQFSLAEAYRRGGQFDAAIAIYDSLLAKDPASLDPKEGKGLALLAKGDFETPAPIFEQIMKVDSKRWKTLNAIGILFATRNLNQQAQSYFEEALKYNPSSPSIMNNAGLSEALNSHYDAAIGSLSRAASLAPAGSPDIKRINLNMATVYAITGRLDEAKAIAEKYYSGAALENNMGIYAHLAKDDQLAKTYLNMALTDSKVYYPKAWDNLQTISGESPDTVPSSVVTQSPVAPIAAPAATAPAASPATSEPAMPAMKIPPSE